MKEIRIHARAGQGAITSAVLLGEAYFAENKFAYCFPSFGAARMGAPMNAFIRTDAKPIRLRSQIYEPDYVIVIDGTLLRGVNCLSGLKNDGIALINHREGMEIPKPKEKQRIYVIPANDIAQKAIGRPLGNTALLGAYAAASGEIKLESLIEAIKKRMKGKVVEGNIEAVKQGFEFVQKQLVK